MICNRLGYVDIEITQGILCFIFLRTCLVGEIPQVLPGNADGASEMTAWERSLFDPAPDCPLGNAKPLGGLAHGSERRGTFTHADHSSSGRAFRSPFWPRTWSLGLSCSAWLPCVCLAARRPSSRARSPNLCWIEVRAGFWRALSSGIRDCRRSRPQAKCLAPSSQDE